MKARKLIPIAAEVHERLAQAAREAAAAQGKSISLTTYASQLLTQRLNQIDRQKPRATPQ